VSKSSRYYTGKAQVSYPTGHLYDGDFVNGLRTGTGIYTYTLEEGKIDKYEGEWLDNFKHGIGKMVYSESGEYFGRFENGKRHGEGVFTYKNKDIYSGSWMYGKKHGKGTFIFAATKMKVGIFLLFNNILDCWRVEEWRDNRRQVDFPEWNILRGEI
jgi:radial spoke head protein 1